MINGHKRYGFYDLLNKEGKCLWNWIWLPLLWISRRSLILPLAWKVPFILSQVSSSVNNPFRKMLVQLTVCWYCFHLDSKIFSCQHLGIVSVILLIVYCFVWSWNEMNFQEGGTIIVRTVKELRLPLHFNDYEVFCLWKL